MKLSSMVSAAAGVIPLLFGRVYFATQTYPATIARHSGVARARREARKLRNRRGQKCRSR